MAIVIVIPLEFVDTPLALQYHWPEIAGFVKAPR
jgi:hypothetical protein